MRIGRVRRTSRRTARDLHARRSSIKFMWDRESLRRRAGARTDQPMCLRALRTPEPNVVPAVERHNGRAGARAAIALTCAHLGCGQVPGRSRGSARSRERSTAGPVRGAADHDRVAAGRVEHGACASQWRIDVAIRDHRDAQRCLHRGHGLVFGRSLCSLARACGRGPQPSRCRRLRRPARCVPRCVRRRTSRCASST